MGNKWFPGDTKKNGSLYKSNRFSFDTTKPTEPHHGV